jgi:hypothetical protein
MAGLSNVNGILPVMSLQDLQDEERRQAEQTNAQPYVQGLAGYVRQCWSTARTAKQQTIEQRLLQCVRQRRGEYDPEVLAEIRKSGGTEIYMMLTSNKCRAASSWIRDVFLGTNNEKPWTLSPTKQPTLHPGVVKAITAQAAQQAMSLEQSTGQQVTPEVMSQVVSFIKDRVLAESYERSSQQVQRMEDKMEDQLQEGGFNVAMSQFIEDIVTFPSAFLKGPIVRRKPRMQWLPTADGQYVMDVGDQLVLEWERVDPFNIYPAPNASDVEDGYIIERHKLSRGDLSELIGVEGYSDGAIRAVLDEHGRNGLHDWLYIDVSKAQVEGKSTVAVLANPEASIDALQFWGSVQGKMLLDWGIEAEQIADPLKEYCCEVWLVGNWVIKAVINADPLGRKPYYKASYEEIPGVFWGNSVADLIRPCQEGCNASMRAMVNNMGIASGPQAVVNVDRLPSGEDVTQMYPWKIWQTTSDPYGSSAPPVTFFQPGSFIGELQAVYNQFSNTADEYSGIPRYMSGESAGGAGRTASGMSMMMNNAGKALKQVIANMDTHVMQPMLERLYFYNMRYSEDKDLKGDVNIIARGANSLIVKENAQLRRNEFLQIVGSNPVFSQIVGPEGIANLLREQAKTLDMDTDKLIPPEFVRKALAAAQQNAMAQQATQQVPQGAPAMGSGQQLMDGTATTDNFQPMSTS